ncbi:ImmA/IrrE family metallo-endopeptidase [Desulfovibrio aminophilus]|uniref:ImmA/IrrE family metallo-endopeptidase n=1 Tax=Desulfovibrio aminophilus TaxID=81425 RepID=UPI00339896B7
MNARTLLGRKAMRGSLDVRKRAGSAFNAPICVYDASEKLGIPVWFKGGGSFGGMYSKTNNAILVPSLRPAPRQVFTCAHELGHWYFNHGTKLDEYEDGVACRQKDEEESLADLFAGHLLMPLTATSHAFKTRNINPNQCTEIEFYRVSCQLGVGYTTLLHQMNRTHNAISSSTFERLNKHSPKSIRESLLTALSEDPGHLVVADQWWENYPIDLQVGQVALLPPNTAINGVSVEIIHTTSPGILVQALCPGISSAESIITSWANFIRVSRKDFEGRSIYRHLEEADDE